MATGVLASPFGSLETMVARESIRHLSNASATWWPGGQGVGTPVAGLRVIHDSEQGMAGAQMVNDFNPVATLLESDAQALKRGDVLNIIADRVEGPGLLFAVERARRDGRGFVVADLSEAYP